MILRERMRIRITNSIRWGLLAKGWIFFAPTNADDLNHCLGLEPLFGGQITVKPAAYVATIKNKMGHLLRMLDSVGHGDGRALRNA